MPRRKKSSFHQQKILVITVMAVILLDKLTKILVKSTFQLGESRRVLGNFFKLTYIENQGIAFGLFADWNHPLKAVLLLVLSLVALVFIIHIYLKSRKTPLLQMSFGLILGGAFGNVYDRIIYKRVVDFLNFGIAHYRWPFFNIADSSITIGVIILMIVTLFYEEKLQ
ncbi:MAG: signal peptidase II [bacterium]|nr:signal peptidase II [bacterium]